MSRKDRKHVWTQIAGDKKRIRCPCCRKKVIVREKNGKSWEIEHIIKLCYGGPDIYENLTPICVKCNSDNKPYYSMYDYMAEIGVISQEVARIKVKTLKQLITQLFNADHKGKHCLAITGRGKRCTNLHSGMHTLTCAIASHKRDEQQFIIQHMAKLCARFDKIAKEADVLYKELQQIIARVDVQEEVTSGGQSDSIFCSECVKSKIVRAHRLKKLDAHGEVNCSIFGNQEKHYDITDVMH